MAFSHSPNHAYQNFCQSADRDFSTMPSQQFMDTSYPDDAYNGQMKTQHDYNQQYYSDFSASAPAVSEIMSPQFSYGMPYNHYHQPQEGYYLHHYPPQAANCMNTNSAPDQEEEDRKTEVNLENDSLWNKFSQNVTEMIITRAGR